MGYGHRRACQALLTTWIPRGKDMYALTEVAAVADLYMICILKTLLADPKISAA